MQLLAAQCGRVVRPGSGLFLCCNDQIGVVTGYGFMATAAIVIMPLVTEFYELRKFMLERASVEPGSPDEVDLPNTPPPPDEDGEAAATMTNSRL